jgi:hypothetical protein
MELEDFLRDVASDLRHPADIRAAAGRAFEQLRAGVMPSMEAVRQLRKRLDESFTCARLLPDGSCVWLRKNAHRQGLRRPRPGEKAFCHRRTDGNLLDSLSACDGFVKISTAEMEK